MGVKSLLARNVRARLSYLREQGATITGMAAAVGIDRDRASYFLVRSPSLAQIDIIARLLDIPEEEAHWLLSERFNPEM